MVDYAKKKNDELASLCKERGLAHTGKKADLVKRLEEHDAKQTSAPAATAAQPPAAEEDEIDFGDDEPAPVPATSELAAGVVKPVDAPIQEATGDSAQTDAPKVESTPTDDTAAAAEEAAKKRAEEAAKYNTGMAERTMEEELDKRIARAKRFGASDDSEEIKALERAKKFGTADVPGLLNTALSTKDDHRGKKRGREGNTAAGGVAVQDGGIRKRSKGRPGPSKKGGDKGADEKKEKTTDGGYPSWMTDADKAKADARKALFANK